MSVNDLRNEAKRARARSTAKMSRIRRSQGMEISGSEHDPRRATDAIKSYNSAQLNRYIAQLNEFNNRRTQFTPGDNNIPLPRFMALIYENRASRFLAIGEERVSAMADVSVSSAGKSRANPDADITVAEIIAQRVGNKYNPTVNTPYSTTIRSVKGVTSTKSLAKLIKDLDNKLSNAYLPAKIMEGRQQATRALELMGDTDSADELSTLTDNQFEILWFGTNFAELVFMRYGTMQDRARDDKSKQAWQDNVIEDAADDIRGLLKDARLFPAERINTSKQEEISKKRPKKTS